MGSYGILVGGGPAPGINGVIGAATLAAHARDRDVDAGRIHGIEPQP